MKQKLTIEYCPKCGWLMRSAWMAQELLTTFADEVGEVSLRPSELAGAYKIWLNDTEVLFDRKREGGFLEIKVIKQHIRDRIAPGKSLGHGDTVVAS
ncbi:MAG: SelT/SelW/SelH family protein [Spirosomataceae bacterium]